MVATHQNLWYLQMNRKSHVRAYLDRRRVLRILQAELAVAAGQAQRLRLRLAARGKQVCHCRAGLSKLCKHLRQRRHWCWALRLGAG